MSKIIYDMVGNQIGQQQKKMARNSLPNSLKSANVDIYGLVHLSLLLCKESHVTLPWS
jgi:hypothetical protein